MNHTHHTPTSNPPLLLGLTTPRVLRRMIYHEPFFLILFFFSKQSQDYHTQPFLILSFFFLPSWFPEWGPLSREANLGSHVSFCSPTPFLPVFRILSNPRRRRANTPEGTFRLGVHTHTHTRTLFPCPYDDIQTYSVHTTTRKPPSIPRPFRLVFSWHRRRSKNCWDVGYWMAMARRHAGGDDRSGREEGWGFRR